MYMKKNVELSDYSTFKIGGKARYLIKVGSKKELEEIIEKALKEKCLFCFGWRKQYFDF